MGNHQQTILRVIIRNTIVRVIMRNLWAQQGKAQQGKAQKVIFQQDFSPKAAAD